jgi:arginase
MAKYESVPVHRRIAVIGAPLCDGERELGVEKAPRVIREAGLLDALRGASFRDLGDIEFEASVPDVVLGKVRNTGRVVDGCRRIRRVVAGAVRDRDFPLIIGGDCSLFPGSLAGMLDVYDRIGVLYVDGDADFHTPDTTVSGYYSGMCLAAAVGREDGDLARVGKSFPLIRTEDVSAVGVRVSNVDPSELEALRASRLRLFWDEALRKDGVLTGLHDAVKPLPTPLYLHFDLDVIDPTEMPAVAGMSAGVHHSGGLSLNEASSLCAALGALPLAGMDITLYDPNLDANRTHAKRIVEFLTKILPLEIGWRRISSN